MAQVDPSLELQQLVDEALNDQQPPNSIPSAYQLPAIRLTTPSGEFICPFPECNRTYRRKDLLKRHLTTLLSSPDENHRNHGIWEQIRATGVMTVYTRPRNLTDEQKKQRRKESNLRHRLKYASELKEKRKRRRRVEKVLEGKQVGVQTPDWEAETNANAVLTASTSFPMPEELSLHSAQVLAAIRDPLQAPGRADRDVEVLSHTRSKIQ